MHIDEEDLDHLRHCLAMAIHHLHQEREFNSESLHLRQCREWVQEAQRRINQDLEVTP